MQDIKLFSWKPLIDDTKSVLRAGEKVNLDGLDRHILTLLQQDGRMPYTSIAEELGVAEGTVRKRVTKLIDEGVLRIVGVIDPGALGATTLALVGIRVEGDADEIVGALSDMSEVRYVGVCTGAYDIICEIAVSSNEELYHFLTKGLRKLPGVLGSDTSLIMKVHKHRENWRGDGEVITNAV